LNIARPLLSPLLLENSNQRRKSTKDLGIGAPEEIVESSLLEETSAISFKTPERRRDIKESLTLFTRLEADNSTSRLLARKIEKGFNNQLFENTIAREKIKALETQLEATKSRKRKKVETSPNSRFATTNQINRTRNKDEITRISSSSSPEPEEESDILDEIVVSIAR